MTIKLFKDYAYIDSLKKELEGKLIDLMVDSFHEHNSFTYNMDEDVNNIQRLYNLMTRVNENEEQEEFDPYSHLTKREELIETEDCLLRFGDSNAKMKKLDIIYFSLPAGYTCPFANICKSFAHKTGGKFKSNDKSIKDEGDIRCYAASTEVIYRKARENRWRNLDLINKFKTVDEIADLIARSIHYYEYTHKKISILRMHESGDFYNQKYFDAWVKVAKERTDILFYGYTKAIPFLVKRYNDLPKNFRLIGSVGGKNDDLLFNHPEIRKVYIVDSEEEAREKRLRIDINDFLAIGGEEDFALLLHGIQSPESGKSTLARKNSLLTKNKSKVFKTDRQIIKKLAQKYTS